MKPKKRSPKELLLSIIALSLCWVPLYLHWRFTSPALWEQGSSGAFELMIALWVLATVLAYVGTLPLAHWIKPLKPYRGRL